MIAYIFATVWLLLNEFSKTDTGTKVEVEISFVGDEDLNKILELGFEQGFTAVLGNLDEVLAE